MNFLTTPKIVLFVLFISLSNFVNAQTKSNKVSTKISYGTAIDVGLSKERLALIDSMCISAIKEGDLPGIVALVARNGKIVYNKAFGTSNAATKKALKTDDIFRLASQSKAITATAVMMLWEQGKFRLDDPVSKYIPEFKNPVVLDSLFEDGNFTTQPADKEISIRHLLTHTSGIGYGVIDGDNRFKKIYKKAGIVDLFTTKNIRIGENIKKLATLPLHHNPGEKFTYSESYDVLGYFIEVISGMSFNTFLRTHIFDPLGMDDTWFYLPESKADRLVAVQTKENGKWKNYPVTFYDTDYPIKGAKQFFSGGAGLSSTAEDYAKFLQMYLNKGVYNGKRLLSRTTVNIILANHINDLWGEDTSVVYGLAFAVQNKKGEEKGGSGSEGTFSWGGYFNTQYFADPKEQVIGIILKQTQDTRSDKTGWKFPILVSQSIDN
ncbi:serine hydrolase domain-containing protein [uncultured Winogradskyella sp.]|uniref:serine hydrolase domain-containing protein n=1 Tax=uncultured Winogradskyella sp. TaxID=395353 RepID=UPI0030D894CA|tara:strand:- start:5327 stop:6634 length:1308 start_codon:yes stop_codon:yes gene_type:complete